MYSCGSSTAVALGYSGYVRRLELTATDSIPIFDATSAHQWISCFAEAAPVAPGASLVPGQRNCLGAGSQRVEYLPASSVRRHWAQAAQPTHLVDELTRRRRRSIADNMFARKV